LSSAAPQRQGSDSTIRRAALAAAAFAGVMLALKISVLAW